MRDRPGAAGGAGDGDASLQALRGKPGNDRVRECRLAAEEMSAAGDIEHQAGRRIERDQRGVAVAPIGDRRQQALVCLGIGLGDGKPRMARAGIGQRQSDGEAKARGGIIQRGDAQRALDLVRNDERDSRVPSRRRVGCCGIIRPGRGAAGQAVGRQPAQPDREVAARRRRRAHDGPTTNANGPEAHGGCERG